MLLCWVAFCGSNHVVPHLDTDTQSGPTVPVWGTRHNSPFPATMVFFPYGLIADSPAAPKPAAPPAVPLSTRLQMTMASHVIPWASQRDHVPCHSQGDSVAAPDGRHRGWLLSPDVHSVASTWLSGCWPVSHLSLMWAPTSSNWNDQANKKCGITYIDITHAVHILRQFVSAPTQLHYSHLVWVLLYLRGTSSHRLLFIYSSSLEL